MKDFSMVLTEWYLKKGRDLPWRNSPDPYFIWLSEIILQQTRVEQGLPYYQKFTRAFPEVRDLAEASPDEILRLWQGLGYYSRARNLHSAAKEIVAKYNSVFPETYEEIRSLKGVGDYTSAAIASFAFGLPHAVVDGNVYRFLARCFGIPTAIDSSAGKKEFASLAEKLLDTEHPAQHNQAMMEMGAIICKPANPLCAECPFQNICVAFQKGIIDKLPVKEKKLKSRTRYFNYLLIHDGEFLVISPRSSKDIWQGLFEFPLIETGADINPEMLFAESGYKALINKNAVIENISDQVKHILSHQKLLARFYKIRLDNLSFFKKSDLFKIVKYEDLKYFGMPQLIVKYLSGIITL